jgi:hypothetical protein
MRTYVQYWMKLPYDEANADLEERKRTHPGYNVLDSEYIQFN